ncbi:predicted protein, partial [Nematostella vectensis]
GATRIRQLRVAAGRCPVQQNIQTLIPECNVQYSWSNEDTEPYQTNWTSTINASLPSEWTYSSQAELRGYPYVGSIAVYAGGGYIKVFKLSSLDELNALKNSNWIDKYTRAVFLEISLYNAQVDVFTSVTFLSE